MSDILGDMFGALGAIAAGPAPIIKRTDVEEKQITISTVNSVDCGPETAILTIDEVYVVQRYDTEEEAKKEHENWVKRIEDGQTDFVEVGYGSSIPEEEFSLA
jgi:uncharacterized protein YggE